MINIRYHMEDEQFLHTEFINGRRFPKDRWFFFALSIPFKKRLNGTKKHEKTLKNMVKLCKNVGFSLQNVGFFCKKSWIVQRSFSFNAVIGKIQVYFASIFISCPSAAAAMTVTKGCSCEKIKIPQLESSL